MKPASDKMDTAQATTGEKPTCMEGQIPTSGGPPPIDEEEPEMILQPETRPIGHEDLVIELKGIHAGLVMVESKCIDIDERQSAAAQEKDPSKKVQLKNDQWQSLIAIHKQLLHEYHDFFLASQHPSASPSLRELADKYSMPAKLWRHGVHAFLEVLRHRLPESLEFMLAFIYIAFTMIALLYETVSAFEDIWIECLGDLGRYRMAIEANEAADREAWSNAACFWYNKAADKRPTVGRLYHHLAILARPYSLEQLSLYMRSLTSITPFEPARGSIMTLFNPILQGQDKGYRRPPFETALITIHGILFTSQPSDSPARFGKALEELENGVLLNDYISKDLSEDPSRLKEMGVHIAVSNIAALFSTPKQGNLKSTLRLAYENAQPGKEKPTESNLDDSENLPSSTGPQDSEVDDIDLWECEASTTFISKSSRLAFAILAIFLKRTQDKNVYPLLHVYLTFIWSLVIVQQAWSPVVNETVWKIIEKDIPWVAVCSFLNTLLVIPEAVTARVWVEDFPEPTERPLAEDFIIRGQLYTRRLFPPKWFTDAVVDDDERMFDSPSMVQARMERLIWLGTRIASAGRWIGYDTKTQSFMISDYVKETLNADAKLQPQSVDQDMLDVAALESDVEIAQRTPSESMPDEEGPCLTPGTASNAPSESNDDCAAPSTGRSKPGQNEARTAEFILLNQVCTSLQRLQSKADG